jgi:hypothetical protein
MQGQIQTLVSTKLHVIKGGPTGRARESLITVHGGATTVKKNLVVAHVVIKC